MAASIQFRPQNRDLGVVMMEVDEDLAIFLGMQNVENVELDDSKDPKPDTSLIKSGPLDPDIFQISADDNLLDLEIEKNDYDWLITQPETSLLPSNGEASSLKSELANTNKKSTPLGDGSLHLAKSTNRRPLSSSSSSRDRKPTPSRPIVPAKSKGPRASTPTSRATPRSSTPISRPSIPIITSKSTSRPSTPTRKPSTGLSSTVRSTGPITVKSRPSKPSEMLSLSHDATQIPKITLPKRPSSASRGRPSGPTNQLPSSNGQPKPRQKSCSPSKVRVPSNNVAHKSGSKILSRNRGYINGGDDVNPVLMGTQMVERVVNMRKLAPPKQDEYGSNDSVKKSSVDKGFGRSLSKKSLDMAIRHMDIRRSIPDNVRQVATDFRSGSGKSTSFDVSSSQTSSTDSSKSSHLH